MIQAKVLKDSVNQWGNRLTTLEVEFPRIILSEFNTHRVFSRNSASSRAIPTAKLLERVENDPFMPEKFPVNQPGMSATEYIGPGDEMYSWCKTQWLIAKDNAINSAKALLALGVHKQIANRLLEPFMYHTVIVSSTEWQNFWDLRISEFAQPEIRATAEAMKAAINASEPEIRLNDEWHLPLTGFEGDDKLTEEQLIKVSVARCARVSYLTHDGIRDTDKDIAMFDSLAANWHLSPFEHVAQPTKGKYSEANFKGWTQARWFVEHNLELTGNK